MVAELPLPVGFNPSTQEEPQADGGCSGGNVGRGGEEDCGVGGGDERVRGGYGSKDVGVEGRNGEHEGSDETTTKNTTTGWQT